MCFNTASMDRDPVRRLSNLISQLEPGLARPVAAPLERLVARTRAGDALIVAVVGPSGVGKSALVNRLAGTRVVTTGPLRPTTTAVTVWGEVAAGYLPGMRAAAAPAPEGVALVDTPPAEHAPEIVESVLDLADAALVVVSPDRYADAVVCTLIEQIEARGIPLWAVLSVLAGDEPASAEIIADAERVLGIPVAATSAEGGKSVGAFLATLAGRRVAPVDARDRGAAAFVAGRASELAATLEGGRDEARAVFERAIEALSGIDVDRSAFGPIAGMEWDHAAAAIGALVDETTREAISAFRASVESDAKAAHAVDDAVLRLPAVDGEPIARWRSETDIRATAALRHRRLRPWRARAMREEMWRLSATFDRRPSDKARRAYRDRLADLRIEGWEALATAMNAAARDRLDAIPAALDPGSGVQPDDLRDAAEGLRDRALAPDGERGGADA